jgi:hypothetical protein
LVQQGDAHPDQFWNDRRFARLADSTRSTVKLIDRLDGLWSRLHPRGSYIFLSCYN